MKPYANFSSYIIHIIFWTSKAAPHNFLDINEEEDQPDLELRFVTPLKYNITETRCISNGRYMKSGGK